MGWSLVIKLSVNLKSERIPVPLELLIWLQLPGLNLRVSLFAHQRWTSSPLSVHRWASPQWATETCTQRQSWVASSPLSASRLESSWTACPSPSSSTSSQTTTPSWNPTSTQPAWRNAGRSGSPRGRLTRSATASAAITDSFWEKPSRKCAWKTRMERWQLPSGNTETCGLCSLSSNA